MKVRAGKGLAYWCQGKKISEDTVTNVKVDHNVSTKLINKTMVEVKPKNGDKK